MKSQYLWLGAASIASVLMFQNCDPGYTTVETHIPGALIPAEPGGGAGDDLVPRIDKDIPLLRFETANARVVSVEFNPFVTINKNIWGAGINIDTMTYHHINFSDGSGEWESGKIHSQHLPFPEDEKEWKNFLTLIDWLDFKFYRIGVSAAMIEPINDDSNPQHCHDAGFVWSSDFSKVSARNMELHLQWKSTLRLLKHLNAKKNVRIQLANWLNTEPFFIEKSVVQGVNGQRLISSYKLDQKELAESLACLANYLVNIEKLDRIQFVSFENESEGFGNGNVDYHFYPQGNNGKDYLVTLAEIHANIDEAFNRLGLKNQVKQVGFDSAGFWSASGGENLDNFRILQNMTGDQIGVMSAHMYTADFNFLRGHIESPMNFTIDDLFRFKLNPALSLSVPLILGEFGAHRYPYVNSSDWRDTYNAQPSFIQRLHSASGLIQGFNKGVKSIAFWHLNENYHRQWRLLTFQSQDKSRGLKAYRHHVPEATAYYAMALLSQSVPEDSEIIESRVLDGQDQLDSLFIKRGDQRFAIFANHSDSPVQLKIKSQQGQIQDFFSERESFKARGVTERQHQTIYMIDQLKIENQVLSLFTPPKSIVVVSNSSQHQSCPPGYTFVRAEVTDGSGQCKE